jgi:hypothetical protein
MLASPSRGCKVDGIFEGRWRSGVVGGAEEGAPCRVKVCVYAYCMGQSQGDACGARGPRSCAAPAPLVHDVSTV